MQSQATEARCIHVPAPFVLEHTYFQVHALWCPKSSNLSLSLSLSICMYVCVQLCMYVYTYVCTQREIDRDRHIPHYVSWDLPKCMKDVFIYLSIYLSNKLSIYLYAYLCSHMCMQRISWDLPKQVPAAGGHHLGSVAALQPKPWCEARRLEGTKSGAES